MIGRLDERWPDKTLLHYVGNRSMREITAHLRERLIERVVEAGEAKPEISLWSFYA